ncbi:hypothetical protein B0H12DRAFT_1070275 [Mycena haematopus]|nr:hypothetical protein B0H12DRAFT_1070275 [Mycena haematopus]
MGTGNAKAFDAGYVMASITEIMANPVALKVKRKNGKWSSIGCAMTDQRNAPSSSNDPHQDVTPHKENPTGKAGALEFAFAYAGGAVSVVRGVMTFAYSAHRGEVVAAFTGRALDLGSDAGAGGGPVRLRAAGTHGGRLLATVLGVAIALAVKALGGGFLVAVSRAEGRLDSEGLRDAAVGGDDVCDARSRQNESTFGLLRYIEVHRATLSHLAPPPPATAPRSIIRLGSPHPSLPALRGHLPSTYPHRLLPGIERQRTSSPPLPTPSIPECTSGAHSCSHATVTCTATSISVYVFYVVEFAGLRVPDLSRSDSSSSMMRICDAGPRPRRNWVGPTGVLVLGIQRSGAHTRLDRVPYPRHSSTADDSELLVRLWVRIQYASCWRGGGFGGIMHLK